MNLTEKREELGLSVEEIAEKLRIDGAVVEAWEAGEKPPTRTPQQMQELCGAYQVGLDELIGLLAEDAEES